MASTTHHHLIRDDYWKPPPLQWPRPPGLHLLDHPVGDLADGVLGHRRAVHLGEMRADLTGGQPLGIQRQHHFVDVGQPPLTLLHDHWVERGFTVTRHVDLHVAAGIGQHRLGPLPVPGVAPVAANRFVLVVAEMLAHLLIERGLDHRLRQRLQQPVRPGQRDPTVTSLPDQLAGRLQFLSRRLCG